MTTEPNASMLKILLVEDDPMDAELTISALEGEGWQCCVTRVDGEDEFTAQLEHSAFDLIISDFHLPSFSGGEALTIAQRLRPDTPFIIVSGVLGEENAIDMLKCGATDYVLKQRIARLPQTVERALREAIDRRKRIEAERTLQQTETHFRLLVDALQEYAVVTLDTAGMIRTWNQAARRILGYAEEEVLGRHYAMLFSDEDRAAGVPATRIEHAIREGSCSDDRWLVRRDGRRFYSSGAITAIRSEERGLLGFSKIMRDSTERRIAHENNYFLANHDPLTGLANRSNFHARLQEALAGADRDGNQVALLLLDLDRFKSVNDILGHHVGDLLLVEVAKRLGDCVRETDTVARLGGDEFVIIQTRVAGLDSVRALAEKIIRELTRPFSLNGQPVRTSTSIGVTIYPLNGRDAGELLQRADIAMYRAKSSGRNSYQVFTESMFVEAQRRKSHEDSLRSAIENGEFELFYQPQVELETGRLSGAEVLLRTSNPVLGGISTGSLIAVAEETGLINPLGEWILETACRQIKAWQTLGLPAFKVAVNFSPRQFLAPAFMDSVRRILERTGLAAGYLEMEVTEGLLMAANDVNIEILRRIKELGALISVDDFGTGFSALSYLKHFPIDVIKLDESLIRNLPHQRHDKAIVAAIIGLARNLNVQVVAEGVETVEQLAYLKAHDCPVAQGFLFGTPMDADAFEARLRDGDWSAAPLPVSGTWSAEGFQAR
ncbi:MAG: EAL domain-containing response regulator [Burkholderiaceae bacterium]